MFHSSDVIIRMGEGSLNPVASTCVVNISFFLSPHGSWISGDINPTDLLNRAVYFAAPLVEINSTVLCTLWSRVADAYGRIMMFSHFWNQIFFLSNHEHGDIFNFNVFHFLECRTSQLPECPELLASWSCLGGMWRACDKVCTVRTERAARKGPPEPLPRALCGRTLEFFRKNLAWRSGFWSWASKLGMPVAFSFFF